MPNHLKAMLCVVVAIVAIAFFLYERSVGSTGLGLLGLGLAAFMIVSLWVFPEAKKSEEDLRREGKL